MASLRAKLDPAFTEPSSDALDDARQEWRDQSGRDVPEVLVRAVFDLQRALGSASVEAALTEVTADQFAQAHRGARVFLTPLRLVAARMIDSGDGAAETLLFLLAKLGHQLHKAALILRHNGHGDRIDRTIDSLQLFSATPVVQEAFWETVTQVRAMLLTGNDPPEAVARFAEYWDDQELRAAFSTARSAVRDAWFDLVGPLVEDFLAALATDLSPGPIILSRWRENGAPHTALDVKSDAHGVRAARGVDFAGVTSFVNKPRGSIHTLAPAGAPPARPAGVLQAGERPVANQEDRHPSRPLPGRPPPL